MNSGSVGAEYLTCGPFRALYPELEAIYQRYNDDAIFLMIYIREMHPDDAGHANANSRADVKVNQPRTWNERAQVCHLFCRKLNPTMPIAVDEIDDSAGNAYSGMPGRLYVIDPHGKVAYKSGRGPFGFRAGELEHALVMSLLEQRAAAIPR